MTLKPARLLFALISVVTAPAFAQNVAVVNGKAIPTSRVDSFVKEAVAQGKQVDSVELRDMVKKSLIEREVMMQESAKRGFDKDATVKQQLDNARQTIIINALVRDFVEKNPVTDAEAKTEYDKLKAMAGDKEYHVRHIMLGTDAEARAVIAKLKTGAKFEELAKSSKDQGTAAKGGDLDWTTPGTFPKIFSDAFVALKNGQVTETPVQTPNGFHVIKLDDTRPAQLPKLEEVKPQLTESLQQQKLLAYQDSLLKKAAITNIGK